MEFSRCYVDTLCLGIVFLIGTFIVHRKIQEDYKNFMKREKQHFISNYKN